VTIGPTQRLQTRRAALKLGLFGMGLAVLAACEPAQPAAPTSASPAGAAGTPASSGQALATVSVAAQASPLPNTGGTLNYGGLDDITNLDGHVGSNPALDILFQCFDRLTEYDLSQQPQPRLAESWDISSDYTQIKLNLRKGVQFHTGREFTSDDVKWNFQRVQDPTVGSGQIGIQAAWFTGLDTPDKYTIVLKSDTPRPAVFDLFEFFNMLDPVTMQGPDASTKPVGTGPFTFVEWQQGDHFTAAKNKNYWQTGRPYVDQFVAHVFHDANTMMTQLEAGSLDLVKSPPIQDFARLKNDANYQALLEPPSRFFYVGPNTLVKPLDNKLVRQALAYSLDRQRFADTLELGFGTPQAIPWPPFSPAYDASLVNAYAFDLDKAKSLLAQAGVSNLNLEIWPVSLYPELGDFAQVQQADLAQIGVTLTIKTSDLSSWVTEIVQHQYQGLYSTAWGTTQLFPSTLLAGAAYKPDGNNQAFVSDAYTKLVNDMTAEPDAAKRKQLYAEANQMLIDEAFVWPVATVPFRIAARAAVHDIGFALHDAIVISNAWLG
jgi:peptide/nickel transport system substrate-binding protein